LSLYVVFRDASQWRKSNPSTNGAFGDLSAANTQEYEKVGAAFTKISDVVIAKVDADKHKDLASRFDVRGFPTLKWFPKGSTSPQEYVSWFDFRPEPCGPHFAW
jgi:hypothetical protein